MAEGYLNRLGSIVLKAQHTASGFGLQPVTDAIPTMKLCGRLYVIGSIKVVRKAARIAAAHHAAAAVLDNGNAHIEGCMEN